MPRFKLSDEDKAWIEAKLDEAVVRGMAMFAAYARKIIKQREEAKRRVYLGLFKVVLMDLTKKYLLHALIGLLLAAGALYEWAKHIL